jgi:hypothetical protein
MRVRDKVNSVGAKHKGAFANFQMTLRYRYDDTAPRMKMRLGGY